MLADVLDRDGAELSASETRQRNLANADHLAILNAIWAAETRDARDDRYRRAGHGRAPARLPAGTVPPGPVAVPHPAGGRTGRPGPGEVIRTAIASRDLAGARDIASVLDARIRQRVYPLLPQPQGPWASRVPHLPDPDRQAYLAEIAAMMDDRKQRLGQHAAQTASRLGGHRARPGTRRPGRPPRLGSQGSLDRRLPGDLRLRPPR